MTELVMQRHAHRAETGVTQPSPILGGGAGWEGGGGIGDYWEGGGEGFDAF
jgi:hypothetical protein